MFRRTVCDRSPPVEWRVLPCCLSVQCPDDPRRSLTIRAACNVPRTAGQTRIPAERTAQQQTIHFAADGLHPTAKCLPANLPRLVLPPVLKYQANLPPEVVSHPFDLVILVINHVFCKINSRPVNRCPRTNSSRRPEKCFDTSLAAVRPRSKLSFALPSSCAGFRSESRCRD